ncbi:SpoIIE family protein phosphatase [Streptomyces sp. NPDC052051]|uniref:PP2C family protein-serine/threonine phosphatase n=1 Tax=Streptomyces sp. NPDC052051 TaxID=3154649 RepID=UPI00341A2A38
MPPHLSADRSSVRPPQRGAVDALISQTRRLRGEVDAVRREALTDGSEPAACWQRALCDLTLHQLSDVDQHLAQLRDGLPALAVDHAAPSEGSSPRQVGSAEWNLLTDEASWSRELYEILGRAPATPALTLDELPALAHEDDRPLLAAMVTDCLVDGKPIDGEFRILRPDGGTRTVHMTGEPVLDADGTTTSMWAVLRDVSELRRRRRTVHMSHDALQRQRHRAQAEHQAAVALREAVLPPWRDSLRLPRQGSGALDLAARHLPSSSLSTAIGDWYDALELPDADVLFAVGDLTGRGVSVTSSMATLIGALRGMAVAGTEPGQLMSLLNQLLNTSVQSSLGSTACCRYRPDTHAVTWAQAGHPAPLLFRGGTGRVLTPPEGVLLGATTKAVYGQAEETLREGDLLLLHTEGLLPRGSGTAAVHRLLDLAPRFGATRTAQDCVRTVVEEFGESDREDEACVLVARVVS